MLKMLMPAPLTTCAHIIMRCAYALAALLLSRYHYLRAMTLLARMRYMRELSLNINIQIAHICYGLPLRDTRVRDGASGRYAITPRDIMFARGRPRHYGAREHTLRCYARYEKRAYMPRGVRRRARRAINDTMMCYSALRCVTDAFAARATITFYAFVYADTPHAYTRCVIVACAPLLPICDTIFVCLMMRIASVSVDIAADAAMHTLRVISACWCRYHAPRYDTLLRDAASATMLLLSR